jgi:GT2 family glycosyltransferase
MKGSQYGSQPRVAILILNWNGLRDTLETLGSVNNLQYENVEIFVVDNGSTDYSHEVIAATFPGVHLIASPENLGVAGGRNLGLQTILRHPEIDYVLFLDNDVMAGPTLLDTLVTVAEVRPEIGILGPIVYYQDDPKRIRSDGVAIVFREVTAKSPHKNRLEKGRRPEGVKQVDAINGCCMLIKRQVFEAIGYFNPAYFMVNNETEFCYRAGRKGFHSAVVMHAALWHKVSASTGYGYAPGRAYYTGRSTILFLKEYGRLWHWASTLTCVALSLPLAYLREWRRGNQHAVVMKFRGYLDGLLGRPIDPEVERYFQYNQPDQASGVHVRRHA